MGADSCCRTTEQICSNRHHCTRTGTTILELDVLGRVSLRLVWVRVVTGFIDTGAVVRLCLIDQCDLRPGKDRKAHAA